MSDNEYPNVEQAIHSLEQHIHQDLGNRGLKGIWDEIDQIPEYSQNLLKASSLLCGNCKKILICTGFVIPSVLCPETDGPPGALAIAKALLAIKKSVSIITAPGSNKLLKSLLNATKLDNQIELIEAPLISDITDNKKWAHQVITSFDCLVSIEILGAAEDGKYYNMKGSDTTHLNSPIDVLFQISSDLNIPTISIGDGGNEIGMGNIHNYVVRHIPNGRLIGSVVNCNVLITAGVSNWGGYALAIAIFLFEYDRSEFKSQDEKSKVLQSLNEILPSIQLERLILDVMLTNGAVDGPTCKAIHSVDALDFEKIHVPFINDLLGIANTYISQ